MVVIDKEPIASVEQHSNGTCSKTDYLFKQCIRSPVIKFYDFTTSGRFERLLTKQYNGKPSHMSLVGYFLYCIDT